MGRTNPASFKRWSRAWTWIALLLLLCGIAIFARHLLAEDRTVLLCSDGQAEWIRADQPFDVAAKRNTSTSTLFAIKLEIPKTQITHTLEVTALRRVVIRLDQTEIFDSGPDLSKWKTVYLVPIPRDVPAGSHVLQCAVSNQDGPSLLRLKCVSMGIATDSNWLATTDQKLWNPAAPADRVWEPVVANAVDPQLGEMLLLIPWVLGIFVIGLFAVLRQYRSDNTLRASRVRWLLLGGWLLLALNNMFKIPLPCGYDADSHYKYIIYVADHLALPSPDAGWQFFQSPLYYIISAGLCRVLLALGVAHGTILFLLRSIPLACGALMIDISYRAGRIVFPNRGDLQMIATAVGGLVPVNLYMAQTVSNEPMGAVVSGLILLITLRFLKQPQLARSLRWLAMAGFMLGFAWITKINTVLWMVPLAIAIAVSLKRDRVGLADWFKATAFVASAALLVSGWLMIRNYCLVGKPFFLESSESQSQWWQDPGYRTPRNFYEFGHVFARPIYNGTASVWDSVYGTLWGKGIPSGQEPWNFRFMWCGLWLAIIPYTAIIIGMIRSVLLRNDPHVRDSLRIATLTIGCFIAAILYVYLRLPIFSCAKASYMLGATPCLGLLAAAGFDCVPFSRWMRAIILGMIVCWAVTAYATYFVVA